MAGNQRGVEPATAIRSIARGHDPIVNTRTSNGSIKVGMGLYRSTGSYPNGQTIATNMYGDGDSEGIFELCEYRAVNEVNTTEWDYTVTYSEGKNINTIRPEFGKEYLLLTAGITGNQGDKIVCVGSGLFGLLSAATVGGAVGAHMFCLAEDYSSSTTLVWCRYLGIAPVENATNSLQLAPAEAVTVTTHVGTLTYVPHLIEYVESTAGTTTGGMKIITQGTVATGEVKVDYAAGTLTFAAADAVTAATVRYRHKGVAPA